jgi:hypothetical protein
MRPRGALARLRRRVEFLRRYTPDERQRLLAMLDAAGQEAQTRRPPVTHGQPADAVPLLIPPDSREGRGPEQSPTRRRR